MCTHGCVCMHVRVWSQTHNIWKQRTTCRSHFSPFTMCLYQGLNLVFTRWAFSWLSLWGIFRAVLHLSTAFVPALGTPYPGVLYKHLSFWSEDCDFTGFGPSTSKGVVGLMFIALNTSLCIFCKCLAYVCIVLEKQWVWWSPNWGITLCRFLFFWPVCSWPPFPSKSNGGGGATQSISKSEKEE